MDDKILELLFYTLPALVTGGVAYYFFQMHTQNENNRRRFEALRDNQKQALPLRLQAYERIVLLLERIDPSKLLIRVAPVSDEKADYAQFLIAQIEQEYEHNLSQQIYMTDACWGYVVTAKNGTIALIRKASLSETVSDADGLRQTLLSESFDKPTPSSAALAFIRSEVRDIF